MALKDRRQSSKKKMMTRKNFSDADVLDDMQSETYSVQLETENHRKKSHQEDKTEDVLSISSNFEGESELEPESFKVKEESISTNLKKKSTLSEAAEPQLKQVSASKQVVTLAKKKKRRKSSNSDSSDDGISKRKKKKKTKKATAEPSYLSENFQRLKKKRKETKKDPSQSFFAPDTKKKELAVEKLEEGSSSAVDKVAAAMFILDVIVVIVAVVLFITKPVCKLQETDAGNKDIDGDLSEINEAGDLSTVQKPPLINPFQPNSNIVPDVDAVPPHDSFEASSQPMVQRPPPSQPFQPDINIVPDVGGASPNDSSEEVNQLIKESASLGSNLPDWGWDANNNFPGEKDDTPLSSNSFTNNPTVTQTPSSPSQHQPAKNPTVTQTPLPPSQHQPANNPAVTQTPSPPNQHQPGSYVAPDTSVIPSDSSWSELFTTLPSTTFSGSNPIVTQSPLSSSQLQMDNSEAPESSINPTTIPTVTMKPSSPNQMETDNTVASESSVNPTLPPTSTARPSTTGPTFSQDKYSLIAEDIISDENFNCGVPRVQPSLDKTREKNKAIRNSWPWLARLRRIYAHIALSICGATVLSPRHIIGACHCIDPKAAISDLVISIGDHETKISLSGSYELAKIRKHPFCKEVNNIYYNYKIHDIFLGTVRKELQFNTEVQPACLPSDRKTPKAAENCWTYSWDRSQPILQEYHMDIIEEIDCQERASHVTLTSPSMLTFLRKTLAICTQRSDRSTSCSFESGGPMTCKEGEKWIVYGVASWGFDCRYPSISGVYAAISYSLSWICCFMKNIPTCRAVDCDIAKYS